MEFFETTMFYISYNGSTQGLCSPFPSRHTLRIRNNWLFCLQPACLRAVTCQLVADNAAYYEYAACNPRPSMQLSRAR